MCVFIAIQDEKENLFSSLCQSSLIGECSCSAIIGSYCRCWIKWKKKLLCIRLVFYYWENHSDIDTTSSSTLAKKILLFVHDRWSSWAFTSHPNDMNHKNMHHGFGFRKREEIIFLAIFSCSFLPPHIIILAMLTQVETN